MNDRDALTLYRIAERLDAFCIDNGPMGEDHPFRQEARQLRAIASKHDTDPQPSPNDDCRPY